MLKLTILKLNLKSRVATNLEFLKSKFNAKSLLESPRSSWGMLTWPIQDDWMNITERVELDQKIHTGER